MRSSPPDVTVDRGAGVIEITCERGPRLLLRSDGLIYFLGQWLDSADARAFAAVFSAAADEAEGVSRAD